MATYVKETTLDIRECYMYYFPIHGENENKDGKLCIVMVFETIPNCREKNENKDGEQCILTVFKSIWKCRDNFENKDTYVCIMTLFDRPMS